VSPVEAGHVAEPGQVVTVFRSRLAPGAVDEYHETADRMEAAASAMPGFVDFKTFDAPDGERVSIVTFADLPSHEAWRDHAEHREAQAAGRDRFYASYQIQVCECRAVRRFRVATT
jgi:heme-degrading monooxygenase HmoA